MGKGEIKVTVQIYFLNSSKKALNRMLKVILDSAKKALKKALPPHVR